MRHQALPDTRFFFSTAPLPCPYIAGRVERRVVTELVGRDANALHDQLSMAGFRRSHGICYVPACPSCDACVAVRVVVDEYKPGKSFKRILKRNSDLTAEIVEPVATHEQYALFHDYQRSRHQGGDMSKMDFLDYQALIEDTPVSTFVVEFRKPSGTLAAACLVDRLSDGLSAVYSFFDEADTERSLGTYMILWLIEEAYGQELPYMYLGFWIDGCSNMSYKARFKPLERITPDGWERMEL
ncbi:MAG: arginyltransferase [Rhodospirillales bacterium]|nr:arginyltransferase [Rhodospirillales bacterium]MBO6786655.1 arginyltransferase [Rhodospirillales bacterium]